MDSVHDGLGQRHQSTVRRVPDGQDRPKNEYSRAWTPVHDHVAAGNLRADLLGTVHSPAIGWHGQGHVVHGGAGVPGRNSWRTHPRCAKQRILPAAAHGLPIRSRNRAVGYISDTQHGVSCGARVVHPDGRLDTRVAVLPVEAETAGRGGQMPAVVPIRQR